MLCWEIPARKEGTQINSFIASPASEGCLWEAGARPRQEGGLGDGCPCSLLPRASLSLWVLITAQNVLTHLLLFPSQRQVCSKTESLARPMGEWDSSPPSSSRLRSGSRGQQGVRPGPGAQPSPALGCVPRSDKVHTCDTLSGLTSNFSSLSVSLTKQEVVTPTCLTLIP